MSLKGVELQIALPKTFEAGKVAEQEQQHVNAGQELANVALQKQTERNRTAVLKSDKAAQINEDDPTNKKENEQQHKQKKEQKSSSDEQVQHPFKGHFIDFSG
ncbi:MULTISPECIES: hypothetical protein [Rummeliibacillus]|jgi:hypothetical protein|uniref:hypothetical protein n=1 Tax=Rummeliibacillus TaxID=648802 RepID=UPI0011B3E4AA|nr:MULTISPECIES: hypothetical protein [Rummeliibacillus]MBO2534600.1 hypothetical protein [Rummeliibacillus suwonensis]